ncbi:basic helix-loop-helix protein 100 [Arabidopsis thaliana]|uniref:Isoform 2 of Transcription factor bHLH100 n=1 Tax=Arabidopsis thaliana TaxID=3702 RepID=Q9ZVB5-2|nr:basic helix-loop-helix protein 100 [Arabidopsis thaliana]AEC09952.1 basic helix-loop-helix protein 100 [Arabidopsis thaliana]|eukprot:NP_850349.1 basic helix-loop-helix protein 100 [Arabidopsis thaliana]
MCALVPPLYPNFGWPCGDHSFYETDDVSNTFLDFPLPDLTVTHENVSSENNRTLLDNPVVMKKLNHNASERERRKKINTMFSSLRSCLPPTNQTKLSVSATVSQALKYIPELQEQVKKLMKKKEELSFQISGQRDLVYTDQNSKSEEGVTSYASTVSSTRLSETEVMVQISSLQTEKCSFGNVLSGVEEDGLVLVGASSSRSHGERLFYSMHLQIKNGQVNSEELGDRLLYLYEKCGHSFT